MSGVKGTHGGARAGAGRKSKATVDYQETMRGVVTSTVEVPDWERVVRTALARAQAGDAKARDWLTSYVAPIVKEVSGQVDTDGRFVFVIE